MPTPDWSAITAIISRAEEGGIVLGVSIVPPVGARFSHNGSRRFVAASTAKIPIMIELFRGIDAGRLSLDMRHTMSAQDKAEGSGVLAALHTGLELTNADLAYLMMSISDNSATNILIDHVGMAEVNATMQALGMRESVLGRKMRGRAPWETEQENWAVPDEYAGVIAALLEDRAASAAACAQMLALLETQQNDRRIARHLPRVDRPRWGSKTGSLPGVVNDVGFVVTASGPVILAVFCEAVADPLAGEAIIGDIARVAVDLVV